MTTGLHGITSLAVRAVMAALLWLLALGASAQAVRYIHTDALGSVALVTDQNRNVIERREYEPYGRQLTPVLKDGPGYTGHVQDAVTGLTYMQQRYYNSEIGRFLSVDPVTAYEGDLGHFNRYDYAYNNPYRFTDPDGRAPPGCGDGSCEPRDYGNFWLGTAKALRDAIAPLAHAMVDPSGDMIDPSYDRLGPGPGQVEQGGYRFGSAYAAAEGARGLGQGGGALAAKAALPRSAAAASGGVPRTASGLVQYSEAQGFTRSQSANGPIKYSDANGVVRVTIKSGSSRAPGSAGPHVELRNAEGKRVNPAGDPVERRSPENHTPIDWDL